MKPQEAYLTHGSARRKIQRILVSQQVPGLHLSSSFHPKSSQMTIIKALSGRQPTVRQFFILFLSLGFYFSYLFFFSVTIRRLPLKSTDVTLSISIDMNHTEAIDHCDSTSIDTHHGQVYRSKLFDISVLYYYLCLHWNCYTLGTVYDLSLGGCY